MREMTLRETTTREYDPKTPVCNSIFFGLARIRAGLLQLRLIQQLQTENLQMKLQLVRQLGFDRRVLVSVLARCEVSSLLVVPDGLTQDLTATKPKHACDEFYIGLPVLPLKERLWLDIDDAEKKGQDHVCLDLRLAPAARRRACARARARSSLCLRRGWSL